MMLLPTNGFPVKVTRFGACSGASLDAPKVTRYDTYADAEAAAYRACKNADVAKVSLCGTSYFAAIGS